MAPAPTPKPRETLDTFDKLYTHLLTLPPPLLPPARSHSPDLTPLIASLQLHPTLEAALHILNHDLPCAHFLVRHMQAAPAYEGMLLHGILHRVEGDYENARAWYGDVAASEIFGRVWPGLGGKEDALGFIDGVEGLRKRREGDKQALEEESAREVKAVVEFCREKFGSGRVLDASGAWKQPEDEGRRKVGRDMVVGGEGWREF